VSPLRNDAFEPQIAVVAEVAVPSPVSASLSWMPSRIALLLRDSSRARRFLRTSRGSGRTSWRG